MNNNLADIRRCFRYDNEEIQNYIENLVGEEFDKLLKNCSYIGDRILLFQYCNGSLEKKQLILNSFSDDEVLYSFWDCEELKLVNYNGLSELLKYCIQKCGVGFINSNIEKQRFLMAIRSDREILVEIIDVLTEEKINCLFDYLIDNNDLRVFKLINDKDKVTTYFTNLEEQRLIEIWNKIDFTAANDDFIKVIFKQLFDRNKQDFILEKFKQYLNAGYSNTAKEILIFMGEFQYYPNDDAIITCIENGIKGYFKDDFITYINNIILNEKEGELTERILSNNELIQYVSAISIKEAYGAPFSDIDSLSKMITQDEFEEFKKEVSALKFDDLNKMILEDGEWRTNVIKKLDIDGILKIFPFNCIIGLNDNIFSVILQFFMKYVSYEKALFLIDKLNISEQQKIEIINSVYQKNISNIVTPKNELIERNLNRLLNLEMPVSDEFKEILPDLVALPYDENLFNNLKNICLNINCLEYLQVYLSQLIKFIAKEKELEVQEIEIAQHYDMEDTTVASWIDRDKKVKVYYDRYGEQGLTSQNIMDFTDSCFHELRHAYQSQKMPKIISVNALMCSFENILFDINYDRYKKEYKTIYTEVDARIYGVYEAYEFLKSIDEARASEFLSNNSVVDENSYEYKVDVPELTKNSTNKEEYLKKLKLDKEFIKDREMARSIEYFCSLVNTFFSTITSENIIELRKQNKTLELITDETGRLYNIEEIEIIMNSIKSYSTNDIEFNSQDRDTKLFYAKYLHNLRYGIENGLINLEDDNRGIKKS